MSPYDLPDYHALIRGIRAIDRAGGDSTVARLVCADWLDEHGEADHAELIRVDTEPEADEATERKLMRRQFELTSTVARRAFPASGDGDGLKGRGWADGFVDKIDCTLAWWLTHGPDLCRRHPVREVVITGALLEDAQAIHREGQDFFYRLAVDGEAVSTPAVRLAQRLSEMALSAGEGDGHLPDVWRETIGKTCLRWAESEADRQHGTALP